MRAARLIRGHPILGLSLLITAILAFAISQRVKEPLTIPVMDSMAVAADQARSRSDHSQPVGYPVVGLPAAPAEAPGEPAPPARDPLLGEIHVSSGDTASRPADPSTTRPLRIAYAVGAQSSSVRVTVSADDGAAVATVLGKRTTPTVPVCLRSATWPEMTPNDDVLEQILIWTDIEA